ncbi:hypothetical protein AB6A40_007716 [Gnathostoma spinigerum]|uniref:poly(ADP-ribose) glycohydrolase n=1 Tax=Gnathostoma spinigerum TaxID=75299 RepID=A0ABD6EWQ3_9BILA
MSEDSREFSIEEIIDKGACTSHGHPIKKLKQTILEDFFRYSGHSESTSSSPPSTAAETKTTVRRSIAITRCTVSARDYNKRVRSSDGQERSFVVEEIPVELSESLGEIQRLQKTVEKARKNHLRGSIDAIFDDEFKKRNHTPLSRTFKPASDHEKSSFTSPQEGETDRTAVPVQPSSSQVSKLILTKIDDFRCYPEMFPSLDYLEPGNVALISISSIRPAFAPRPFPVSCTDPSLGWEYGRRYVRLPFSSQNIVDGHSRYDIIRSAISKLTSPLNSHSLIQECITKYTGKHWSFGAIDELFTEVLNDDVRKEYLSSVVPFMAGIALQAEKFITQPIPLLKAGDIGSVTISQQQAAMLLANAFFCTFPCRTSHDRSLPLINFNHLFDYRTGRATEKLKCIFHYFHTISKHMPTGVLTYRRQSALEPNWSGQTCQLQELLVDEKGTIEDDGYGMLQVDFANQFIGGGVLRSGCVQEEIRFLICPELLVSMLVCERMRRNEAIVISGVKRYSNYRGYGNTFEWLPMDQEDLTPRDRFQRIHCEIVAIDALPFAQSEEQFVIEAVDRELLKAYSGFIVKESIPKTIATGNWGCGVFRGNLELKSLIQLMAASVCGRKICYFTFGHQKFATDLLSIYMSLKGNRVTVAELYKIVREYCDNFSGNSPSLFEFIKKNRCSTH